MSVVNNTVRTIKCDREGCESTVTFPLEQEKQIFESTPWMKTLRSVQSLDQRIFQYCSDICEIEAVKTGRHNMPEQKKIVEADASTVAQAAAQADAVKATDATLRSGKGGRVTLG